MYDEILLDEMSPTVCIVKTSKNRIFGMYTDIPWSIDNLKHSSSGQSFVFKLENDRIIKYQHVGGGFDEVWHWNDAVFTMAYGPVAIDKRN